MGDSQGEGKIRTKALKRDEVVFCGLNFLRQRGCPFKDLHKKCSNDMFPNLEAGRISNTGKSGHSAPHVQTKVNKGSHLPACARGAPPLPGHAFQFPHSEVSPRRAKPDLLCVPPSPCLDQRQTHKRYS